MNVTKRCMICLLSVCLFLFPALQLTAGTETHSRSIDQIITEIEQKQNVDAISKINPDLVSKNLLEELGDSVMSTMLKDPQQHEWMERMMGGEGSDQLSSMHSYMGYRYLKNDGDLTAGILPQGMPGYGMMGYGMMGSGQWNNGWSRQRRIAGIGRWLIPCMLIIFLILLASVIILIILLARSTKTRTFSGTVRKSDEIIRSRYAAGEITREEYLQKLKDLKE